MNQYLAREYRYEWDILYLKCSKCWEYKTIDCFSKDKRLKFWVRNQCKECRKKECREYHTKNKEKIAKRSKEHNKKMSDKIWTERDKLHKKTRDIINKLWARPNKCPICWGWGEIIAHHPDYNKIYEVVFCCKSCHNLIHNWTIEIKDKYITILYEK